MKHQKTEPVPTTTTRVYTYGCVPSRVAPVRNEPFALSQMRLANRLWNTLVAIDRAHTERYKVIMHDETQERINTLKADIDALYEEIKKLRQTARKRKCELGDLPERIKALRTERNELIAQSKATSEARHKDRKALLDSNNDNYKRRVKRARQAASRMGLFWGTYNDILQRADVGRKSGELKFKRFRDTGTLTAQIMGGATVDKCVGYVQEEGLDTTINIATHTFFQIDTPTNTPPIRKWRYARMRVGSDEFREPIWLEIPIVYQRNIPPTALIKSVSMSRRIVARQVRWQLNVTVTLPTPALTNAENRDEAIAIDIGWRLLPSKGQRVGYWVDTSNIAGELVVDANDMSLFDKVSSLQATCKTITNEAIATIDSWLQNQTLPEIWKARTAYFIQWKSSNRVADLVRWWSDNRLPNDSEVYTYAIAWRKQYLHLDNWRGNLEDQLRRKIREQYRIFAAGISRSYKKLVIEDFDMRGVVKRPGVLDDNTNPAASGQRQRVSPSELRAALINACRREGMEVIKVDAKYTTMECYNCQHIDNWDAASTITHRCSKCQTLYDQDENAARNLLRAAGYNVGANEENKVDNGGGEGGDVDCSQNTMEVVDSTV